MYRIFIAFFLLLIQFCNNNSAAQPVTDTLMQTILSTNHNAVFNKVIQHPQTYRCQIIYTQINRNKSNQPTFKNYYFHYDSLLYFNPASTVKLPLALLALEKLNKLHIKDVNKYTAIQYDSSYPGQVAAYKDTTSENGLPSIAHYIKRAFLISENDPYNRLYQFVGQQSINRSLHEKGYNDVRITRQFMGFSQEQNRHTNPVRFVQADGRLIYQQPPAYNTDSFDFSHTILLGKAHYNSKDSLINEPFNFTWQNNISLKDLQQILQS